MHKPAVSREVSTDDSDTYGTAQPMAQRHIRDSAAYGTATHIYAGGVADILHANL